MAPIEDDAFYEALDVQYKCIETALSSKGNLSQQTRDDARQALDIIKSSIVKNFERLRAANFMEACKASLQDAIFKPSYASVAASNVNNKDKSTFPSEHGLIVDSENCSSDDIKKIIKLKVNPIEAKLGIRDFKNIGVNKVLIKCCSEDDRNRLQSELKEKSPEFKISLPKGKNPTVLVKNVPNDILNEDLLKVIFDQNPEFTKSDEIMNECRVRFTLKKFDQTKHVVIETHPIVRKEILRQARLKIGWNVCIVDEFLIINRCYKCLGYNHRASECSNRTACFNCSEEHKSSDCPKKNAQVCVNCIRFNHKTNKAHKKVNIDHKPFSECCPSHIFMSKSIQSRINYG